MKNDFGLRISDFGLKSQRSEDQRAEISKNYCGWGIAKELLRNSWRRLRRRWGMGGRGLGKNDCGWNIAGKALREEHCG